MTQGQRQTPTSHAEVVIVGGGLAGTLAAWQLMAAGQRGVVMIDAHDPRRASAAPRAMAHLYAGRSFQPRARLFEAFEASNALLRAWRAVAPGGVLEMPMVRLLVEGDRSSDQLLTSWLKHKEASPEDDTIARWSPTQVAEALPWLKPSAGALVYGPAWSVALGEVIPAVQEALVARGMVRRDAHVEGLTRTSSGWRAQLRAKDAQADPTPHGAPLQGAPEWLEAERVVLSPGFAMGSWFPALQGSMVGGELWTVALEAPLSGLALCSSAGGYLAPGDGELTLGATRWPGERWASRDDEEARGALLAKAARLSPLPLSRRPGRLWRAARWIFQGDRIPLTGELPEAPGVWLLGAFGSRGLQWGPWAALCLARAMMEGRAVPARVGLGRAGAGRWGSPRVTL